MPKRANDTMEENILEITNLIEDKEFPARRNISDYIILLLHDLNVKKKLIQEVEKRFNSEYEKRGDQICFSQTEWANKVEVLQSKVKQLEELTTPIK